MGLFKQTSCGVARKGMEVTIPTGFQSAATKDGGEKDRLMFGEGETETVRDRGLLMGCSNGGGGWSVLKFSCLPLSGPL